MLFLDSLDSRNNNSSKRKPESEKESLQYTVSMPLSNASKSKTTKSIIKTPQLELDF